MGKRTRTNSPIPKPAKKESADLFQFARKVLAEDSGVADDELVKDQHVCGLIYEQYPYGSLWKTGEKDVGTVVEMDLLARNLGIPQQWLYDLFCGQTNTEEMLQKYRKIKGKSAHGMVLESGGRSGFMRVELCIHKSNPQRAAVFSQLLQSWMAKVTEAPDPDLG